MTFRQCYRRCSKKWGAEQVVTMFGLTIAAGMAVCLLIGLSVVANEPGPWPYPDGMWYYSPTKWTLTHIWRGAIVAGSGGAVGAAVVYVPRLLCAAFHWMWQHDLVVGIVPHERKR